MIPKRFTLLGHTYTVKFKNELVFHDKCLGRVSHNTKEIELQRSTKDYPLCDTEIEQTYWHEVVHVILNRMSEDKLQDNEQFVDVFASMLHQVLKTSK